MQTFIISKLRILLIMCMVMGLTSSTINAQLTVSNTLTPQQLVQNILIGGGVTVSNVTYTGATGAIGEFNGTASNIGLPSGVILCSGSITNAPGPNNSGSTGTCNSTAGDPLLDSISLVTSYDAAVLEFDFIPITDTVKFNYVFASEEYSEYVCSTVNDAFGFFLTGPGIVGTKNLAIIPGTNIPVSINTLNAGNPSGQTGGPGCDTTHSAFFIDNENPVGQTVQYDGFTVPLQAIAVVIPCQTYHIKLAIGDGGDCVWDSGVFLEAGSFSGGLQLVSATTYTAPFGLMDSVAVEGCAQGFFNFKLPYPLPNAYSLHFAIGGSAINGTDYQHIVDSVTFPAGSVTAQVPIIPYQDGITEPDENITIIITYVSSCNIFHDSTGMVIRSVDSLRTNITTDTTTICAGDPVVLRGHASGGYGNYTYNWDNMGQHDSIIVYPGSTTTYMEWCVDQCNQQTPDSITIHVIAPPNMILSLEDSLCSYENTIVAYTGSALDGAVPTWDFGGGEIISGSGIGPYVIHWSNSGPHMVTLHLVNGTCYDVADSADIFVKACDIIVPNIFTPNGDGKNDFLVIHGMTDFPGSKLEIFNRWGRKVFESTSYNNDWDGGDLSDGVYYYVVTLTTGDKYKGNVTLRRNEK